MSRSRLALWVPVASLLVCVGACGKQVADEPPPTAPDEDLQALADGNNAFAFDLYQKLAEGKKNVLFSPYSIRTALAMTYAGAGGETAAEMKQALHYTLPDDRLHPAFGATAYRLSGASEKEYELNVANSLWGQKGFAIQPTFLDLTKRNYAAGFREADFIADTEAARQAINAWVAEQTKDKIEELLHRGDLTPETRLVLVNALYFKGKWAQPFDARLTTDVDFRVTPERAVPVRMMNQSGDFSYAETDNAQVLYLPYRASGDTKLGMMVVLPKAADGLPKLEEQLTAAQVRQWLGSMHERPGHVLLPRFEAKERYSLKSALDKLGMKQAFGDAANFSGITTDSTFFIGNVIHEAVIEVDEEGTVAAAATAVTVEATKLAIKPRPPFAFRADHPFLFFICAPKTGAVLFCGRFSTPR